MLSPRLSPSTIFNYHCQKLKCVVLYQRFFDNNFKMSEKLSESKQTGENSGSKTSDDKRVFDNFVHASISEVILKTIGTQCGGYQVDDENIIVGRLCYSPPYEPEIEETAQCSTDALNKVLTFYLKKIFYTLKNVVFFQSQFCC